MSAVISPILPPFHAINFFILRPLALGIEGSVILRPLALGVEGSVILRPLALGVEGSVILRPLALGVEGSVILSAVEGSRFLTCVRNDKIGAFGMTR
jgi:hypothetical protein